jgi:hypothetical protein
MSAATRAQRSRRRTQLDREKDCGEHGRKALHERECGERRRWERAAGTFGTPCECPHSIGFLFLVTAQPNVETTIGPVLCFTRALWRRIPSKRTFELLARRDVDSRFPKPPCWRLTCDVENQQFPSSTVSFAIHIAGSGAVGAVVPAVVMHAFAVPPGEGL